ncbi:unnamed protein product [Phytophthora lilii]|uniref:Unnamed protein product n=1 Tax=Phytophthora lilii TaxID=2077276 RepID=A0A9W6UAZ1_9STRA|nr:unnamed protein product [Phytophthora lilii]
MGKGKQQQTNPPAGSNGGARDGDELAGSTLEDYFASHKVSGHVSQHLLNSSTDNDVMAAEKVDDEEKESGDDRISEKEVDAHTKSSELKSEQDGYEDDYESETTPQAEPPSELAGMTLSDYLHVKDDSSAEAQEKTSRAGSFRVLPPQLAAAGKKIALASDVSGMSLDHYLGAASGEDKSEDHSLAHADKKMSPKVKQKGSKSKLNAHALPQAKAAQQPFSVKGSGIIHGPHTNTSTQNVSSDEESSSASSPSSSLTPFQRRQKRKDKARTKQQRHAGSGSSISKAILMAEAAQSPSTIVSVIRDREKRKTSMAMVSVDVHSHRPDHHGSHSSASTPQPPLPKLAASPSLRSLSHKEHEADDDTAKKLPPL